MTIAATPGLLLALLALLVGDDVSVRGPSPSLVTVGETARVVLVRDRPVDVVPASSAPEPRPAPVDGLAIVPLPPTSEEVQAFAGGVLERRLREVHAFAVTPRRAGRFERPAFPAAGLFSDPDPAATLVAKEDPAGPAGGSVAFVEVEASRAEVFLNEEFAVVVRFGFEESFLRDALVPLFGRRLDVPVRLAAPWLAGSPDAEVRTPSAASEAASAGVRFALHDEVAAARRTVRADASGRRFVVLEVLRRVRPTVSGVLRLDAPRLEYAYATRFEEGLFDRTPMDRHEAFASGPAAEVRVRPLEDAGRPESFRGTVTTGLTLDCAVSETAADVGEGLRVVLTLAVDGEAFSGAPPPYPLADGFHLRGRRDEPDGPRLVTTLDLTPTRSGTLELGPFETSWFDPAAAAYRTTRSEPIAIHASGEGGPPVDVPSVSSASEAPAARAIPGVNDLHPLRPLAAGPPETTAAPGRSSGPFGLAPLRAWMAALLLPLAAAAGIALQDRAARRRRLDPGGRAARRAARRFRRELRGGSDPVAAFETYLAARLRTTAPAVVDPSLSDRLARVGVPPDEAARAAARLEAARAPRFGGPEATVDRDEWIALVDRLERAFASPGRRP